MRRLVARLVRSTAFLVLRTYSPKSAYDGIRMISLIGAGDPSRAFAQVAEALRTLRSTDPRRFARARRYLRWIIVADLGGGSYGHELRGCFLDLEVLAMDPLRVAAVIVHESTHGYLFAKGFQYTPATRRREEQICVKESLGFLRRTEAGAAIEPEYRDHFEREMAREHPWFSDVRIRQRSTDIGAAYDLPPVLRALRRFMDG